MRGFWFFMEERYQSLYRGVREGSLQALIRPGPCLRVVRFPAGRCQPSSVNYPDRWAQRQPASPRTNEHSDATCSTFGRFGSASRLTNLRKPTTSLAFCFMVDRLPRAPEAQRLPWLPSCLILYTGIPPNEISSQDQSVQALGKDALMTHRERPVPRWHRPYYQKALTNRQTARL